MTKFTQLKPKPADQIADTMKFMTLLFKNVSVNQECTLLTVFVVHVKLQPVINTIQSIKNVFGSAVWTKFT